MGEIGRAMFKAGLVSEEQLQKAENSVTKEQAEQITSQWRKKYGSDILSKTLFMAIFKRSGWKGIKKQIELDVE